MVKPRVSDKVPKKPLTGLKPPPELKAGPNLAFDAVMEDVETHSLITSTATTLPFYSSPARPTAAMTIVGMDKAPNVVTPSKRISAVWQEYMESKHNLHPLQKKQKTDITQEEADFQNEMERSGLLAVGADRVLVEKKPEPSNNDAVFKCTRIVIGPDETVIVFRFAPNNPHKQCFPDFKMYRMMQSRRTGDRPDFDLTWMEKFHFDSLFHLWYEDQEPVPSFRSEYTTRLYSMRWPGFVNDSQVMVLATLICKKLNAFRVDPTTTNDRPDSAAVVEDTADPNSLFWIPNDHDPVWNDVVSNAAALDILGKATNRQFGKLFFSTHETAVSRHFRQGTLDLETALRIGAPLDWMSHAAQSEWMTLNNINEQDA